MALSDIIILLRKDIEKDIPGYSSSKLKVTAVDICREYFVLGTNAGTLFFFSTENSRFMQKLQTKRGRITRISVSPDAAFLACASSSGYVNILKIPNFVSRSNLHPVSSRKHERSTVTALCWSSNGKDLYIGDSDGILSLLHVPPNLASSLILTLTHYLMKMDSAIYQIDSYSQYLLVSTLTKSFVCNTRLESYSVIGTKPRQGEYGGCIARVSPNNELTSKLTESLELSQQLDSVGNYYNAKDVSVEKAVEVIPDFYNENEENRNENNYNTVNRKLSIGFSKFTKEDFTNDNEVCFRQDQYRVFCARPGFRIWESNFIGSVIATHQLKNAVPEHLAEVVLCNNISVLNTLNSDRISGNSFSFKKVYRFYNEYLLTNSSSVFYIIDPSSSKIILSSPVYDGIQDIKAFDNSILILTSDSKVLKYLITTIDIAILTLHSNALFVQCAQVCLNYATIFKDSYLLRHCWESILNNIISNVNDVEIVSSITCLKEKMSLKYSEIPYLNINEFRNLCVENGCENDQEKVISQRNIPNKIDEFNSLSQKEELGGDEKRNTAVNIVHDIPSDSNTPPSPLSLQKLDRNSLSDFQESTFKEDQDFDKALEEHTENTHCKSYKIISSGNSEDSSSSDSSVANENAVTLSNKTNCALLLVKELEDIVFGVKTLLKYNLPKSLKKALLILFLKYYVQANNSKYQSVDYDDNVFESQSISKSSFSAVNENELVLETSLLLLLCFEEKIILSSCYKDTLNFEHQIRSHSLTPKIFKDIDKFYAYLLSEDKGLISCSILLNNFHSIEIQLGIMSYSWLTIMRKVTTPYDNVHDVKILSFVDFSRSQRTQYLRNFLDAEGWASLMAAISEIHHPTALYDIYYFLGYFLMDRKNSPVSNIFNSLYDYFFMGSCNIEENYSKYFSSCLELQNDIIASFLCKYREEEFICSCKFPLPNSHSNESDICDIIKTVINVVPLYDPPKIYTLFRKRYFYPGIFNIGFRYKINPLSEMVPWVLQSFHIESILCLLREIDITLYPYVMKLLIKMFSVNDDTSIKCLNCCKQLSICTASNVSPNQLEPNAFIPIPIEDFTKENNKYYGNNYVELKTYSSLWEVIYTKMIENIGIQKCTQMLQELEEIPSLIAIKRLIIGTTLHWFSPSMNTMDGFKQVQNDQKFLYSNHVCSSINKIAQHATAISKEEACQTFYFRKSNSGSENYIDSSFNTREEEAHILYELRRKLHVEISKSVGNLPFIEVHDDFDNKLSRKNHHWGVKARIVNGVCYLCQLGLGVDVMVKAGGLTVFPCGHAYHTVCLAPHGKFCLICSRSNLK